MRGDVVFRVYGVHAGRADDLYFGTFRTRGEAEREVTKLTSRADWAAQYHDAGFVIREHIVEPSFEVPSAPKPRDRYYVRTTAKPNGPGTWDSTLVEVFARGEDGALEARCRYERNYAMLQTFEPFRRGSRDLALISRNYTESAVMDLSTGEVIAEDTDSGFCPVGFYVPDWWDLHDGRVIPGSKNWDEDYEWPTGTVGFVWGCQWGDDSSWKVQCLDLSRIEEGILKCDARFGYVPLATGLHQSACFSLDATRPSLPPPFIEVEKYEGVVRVRLAVELRFDLATGDVDEEEIGGLRRRAAGQGT